MAVSTGCFRSLIRSLRTKDPVIGALCPSTRLLSGGRMDGEPGGCGKSAGRGTGPPCGVLAATFPRSRRGPIRPVLIGGSGLSPRCRFPRPKQTHSTQAPARFPSRGLRRTAGRRRATSPHAVKGQTQTGLPLHLPAVAEGFEPSVSFPTLAFEASSFGRSDTLPRESLDHPGRASKSDCPRYPAGAGKPGQRSRKKAVRRAAQSASSTPGITSGRWLSRRSRTTSQREPAAPAFSSRAP